LGELLQASEPEWIRAQAAASLGFIGPDAQNTIPALIAALGDKENTGVRVNAIGALNRIGGDSSVLVPVFTASLDDPRSDVRDWAATGLGKFGRQAESAVPNLLKALSKPDEEARVLLGLEKALETIGPTTNDASPVLVKLFSHPSEGVRNWATNVLKRVDPETAARVGAK
jgi:HEAT repeat protein